MARHQAPELVWRGKYDAHGRPVEVDVSPRPLPAPSEVADGDGPPDMLVRGDNAESMRALLPSCRGAVRLVYIDPPYAAGVGYTASVRAGDRVLEAEAYRDVWAGGLGGYLAFMHERLTLIAELLAEDGHLYLHCDHRANSHLRLLLDEILGPDAYRNEIVWTYGGKGLVNARGNYVRNWGSILYYARPGARLDLRSGRVTDSVRKRWGRYMDADDRIRFGVLCASGDALELEKATRAFRRREGREPRDTDVARDYSAGGLLKDVWDDVPIVRENEAYAEYLGYRTQKPLALLERIVRASTSPGDLVADFFCGTGTTCVAAHRLGRRFIGVDDSRLAAHIALKRLLAERRSQAAPGSRVRAFEVVDVGGWSRRAGGKVEATLLRAEDGRLDVRLEGYRSADGSLAGLDAVDAWSVDFDRRPGEPFRHCWHAARLGRSRELPLETDARPEPGEGAVWVKAADVLGGEAEAVLRPQDLGGQAAG